MPASVAGLNVEPLRPDGAVPLVFSALPADVAGPLEDAYARAGCTVVTNAAAHRMDPDVPLLIPEVNPGHAALVERQRARRGGPGFIAAHANCSTTQLALALRPLHDAFGLERVLVTTLQAVSPLPRAASLIGNVIPSSPARRTSSSGTAQAARGTGQPAWRTHGHSQRQCNQVPVADGHTACAPAFARETRPESSRALASFGQC
jgi:aspartate-semialdehyde dehydrogenase